MDTNAPSNQTVSRSWAHSPAQVMSGKPNFREETIATSELLPPHQRQRAGHLSSGPSVPAPHFQWQAREGNRASTASDLMPVPGTPAVTAAISRKIKHENESSQVKSPSDRPGPSEISRQSSNMYGGGSDCLAESSSQPARSNLPPRAPTLEPVKNPQPKPSANNMEAGDILTRTSPTSRASLILRDALIKAGGTVDDLNHVRTHHRRVDRPLLKMDLGFQKLLNQKELDCDLRLKEKGDDYEKRLKAKAVECERLLRAKDAECEKRLREKGFECEKRLEKQQSMHQADRSSEMSDRTRIEMLNVVLSDINREPKSRLREQDACIAKNQSAKAAMHQAALAEGSCDKSRMETENVALQNRINELESRVREQDAKDAMHQARPTDQRIEHEPRKTEKLALRKLINELESRIREQDAYIAKKNQSAKDAFHQAALAKETSEHQAKLQAKQVEISALQKNINELEARVRWQDAYITKKNQSVKDATHQDAIHQATLAKESTKHQTELRAKQLEISDLQGKIEKLESRIREQDDSIAKMENESECKQRACKLFGHVIGELKSRIREQDAYIASLSATGPDSVVEGQKDEESTKNESEIVSSAQDEGEEVVGGKEVVAGEEVESASSAGDGDSDEWEHVESEVEVQGVED